jgi:hypothetical protein
MRATVLLGVTALVLVACGTGSASAPRATALTVTYWETGPRTSEPVRWTLRCNPARGTLPRPAVACRRLAAGGTRLFAPVPPDAVCTQIWGGPQVARVVGTVRGMRVWTTFSRENGCQIGRWSRVSPWLLPLGGATR